MRAADDDGGSLVIVALRSVVFAASILFVCACVTADGEVYVSTTSAPICQDGEVCYVEGDDTPRQCFIGLCGLSCSTVADCPPSTCRKTGCWAGICIYTSNTDGESCTMGNQSGTCAEGACVLQE